MLCVDFVVDGADAVRIDGREIGTHLLIETLATCRVYSIEHERLLRVRRWQHNKDDANDNDNHEKESPQENQITVLFLTHYALIPNETPDRNMRNSKRSAPSRQKIIFNGLVRPSSVSPI